MPRMTPCKHWECILPDGHEGAHCTINRATDQERDAFMERNRDDRAALLEDKARMNWCEENLDDVTVFRDLTTGTRFEITYCADESGCAVEKQRTTFREAIDAARAVIEQVSK